MVWPTLVVVEALSAVIFLFLLLGLSFIANPPLVERANATVTPNPAKAPWYFLNLQELLLHMHPALAGVIVPTVALVAIAAIPFFDRSPLGVGILFTSDKGKKIVWFSAIFTVAVEFGLIMFDNYIGVTKSLQGKVAEVVYEQIIPVAIMIGFTLVLVALLKMIYRPTRRELIIGLFTGFVVSYFFLTIIGTFFRGYGMELQLYWPWVDLQHAAH